MRKNIKYETLPVSHSASNARDRSWSRIYAWISRDDHNRLKILLKEMKITQEEFVQRAVLEKLEKEQT